MTRAVTEADDSGASKDCTWSLYTGILEMADK